MSRESKYKYDNNGIGLNRDLRKIVPFPRRDLTILNGISSMPYDCKVIYWKENGNGKKEFYEHRGYADRSLNSKNIHPSQIDEDEEVRVQRISPRWEEELRKELEE